MSLRWRMAREVAHLRVRVLADAYHVRQENEDLGSLAKVGPIAHVHIAQQAERLFPTDDDAQLANLFRKLTATGEHQAQLVTIDLGIQGAWLIAGPFFPATCPSGPGSFVE